MRRAFELYLSSDLWANVRAIVIKRFEGRCYFCGRKPDKIIVHHKRYANWGKGNHEEVFDCVPSCENCHVKEHKKMHPDIVPFFAKVFYEWEYENNSIKRRAA